MTLGALPLPRGSSKASHPALEVGDQQKELDARSEGKERDMESVGVPNKDKSAHAENGTFAPMQRSAYIGFLAQYFSVGIISGGLPGTMYGVFMVYLNVPSYVYTTMSVVAMLPWSFKFFFGLINDTVPVFGLRRKPYMVLGWSMCAVVLVILSRFPLPPPYWCIDDATGMYAKLSKLGDGSMAAPCNPDSAKKGGIHASFMMLAALGYVIADVAADGMTTELAKAEPMNKRGSTQTSAYLTRTIGQTVSTLFVGLCMNGKLYGGSFSWTLSFAEICMGLAVPAAIMVPVSAFLVCEPKTRVEMAGLTCSQYASMSWNLLKNKAFFYVVLFVFLTPVIGGISTTAGPEVKMNWARAGNLQNQLFSALGNFLFILGLWVVKARFLNVSWRLMLALTTVFLQVVDSFFSALTIFGVVRNQYFYLGEAVLTQLPAAANFVVSTFVIVEMADDGNEGLVYGLLTTAANLGSPFASAIANVVFGLFEPSLSDAKNYIADTSEFRLTVFYSFLLSYATSIASLGMLAFLPDQKRQAQERKRSWGKRPIYGVATIVMLVSALLYSLVVDFLSMSESTMCLKIVGGKGC